MQLGIHDLLPLEQGETTLDRYQKTIEMVQALEEMGYDRYWASEHHGMVNNASSSPEILIAYLAAKTQSIRLGTGGTMIVNYSPLKVAEWFKTLSLLAPGRIDLGIGRAPGADQAGMIALASGNPISFDYLYEKAQVILDYMMDQKPSAFYGQVKAIPEAVGQPAQPWMLGSSGNSAIQTGKMGLGYSFARWFALNVDADVFDQYRKNFKPSDFFSDPRVMVSYLIICADSPEEADYLAKPMEIQRASDLSQPLLSPKAAQEHSFSLKDQALIDSYYQRHFMIKGTPDQVKAILDDEIKEFGIDELMIYSPIPDQKARLRSYELLHQALK